MARVEEDRNVLEDLPTLVAAAERREAEDAQELVISHQVLKSVSSVVRMVIGRVIIQRWMMARRIRRNETLELTHIVRGPATSLTILVMKSVPQIRFRWIPCVVLRFLLSRTTMSVKLSPVQDDDECEAHAAFLVESEGFGVLDCGATTSFGSVEGAEALFSKSHEHDTRIPEVDPFGGRSFNFGDGASSKATSLSRLPVRNDALGDFWIPVHLFVDQPKPTPLMLGMDFLKEQRCVIDLGNDLIQFPMQSDCWWPLFVSSRGLYSMPPCGQHWEPSSREQ